jgi:DNA-binding LytR/AlgR family response regulator
MDEKPMYLHLERIIVFKEKRILFKKAFEIFYFYASDGKVYAVAEERYLVRASLDCLSTRLSSLNFLRCHKNYLVNLAKIEEIIPWFNSTLQLKLESYDGAIPVSRNYLKSFKEQTGLAVIAL